MQIIPKYVIIYICRTGTSDVIFGYNGRDGVVTEKNGLIYMRARYYSPEMRRFINADIIAGKLNNAVTLNRYAYANANPAMFIDPTGLLGFFTALAAMAVVGISLLIGGSSKREDENTVSTSGSSGVPKGAITERTEPEERTVYNRNDYRVATQSGENAVLKKPSSSSNDGGLIVQNPNKSNNETTKKEKVVDSDALEDMYVITKEKAVDEANNKVVDWAAQKMDDWIGVGDLILPNTTPPSVYIKGATTTLTVVDAAYDAISGMMNNYQNGASTGKILYDAAIDIGFAGISYAAGVGAENVVSFALAGTSIAPGVGTAIGLTVGIAVALITAVIFDSMKYSNGLTGRESIKSAVS